MQMRITRNDPGDPNISVLPPTVEAVSAPTDPRQARRQRRLKIMLPILLVLVFLVYAFTTNFIPSESMLPTLKPGDHIITMRRWLAYPGGRRPARGDIIVFNAPPQEKAGEDPASASPTQDRPKLGVFRNERGEILIKRVVGLPGESVQVAGKDLWIDGRKIPSHIPNSQYLTSAPAGFYAVREPLKLGSDELFVMGDNSDNSDDSRYWGPLKLSKVLGRFVCVLYNEGSNGPNVRRARTGGDR